MSRKRTKRAAAINNNATNAADPFVLMSDILDKLHIINYHQEFLSKSNSNHNFIPLTQGYFSYSNNIAEQFAYFQSLCTWLFQFIEHSFMEWDDLQDPNSISNNILQECKKLQFPKEFPSTKLRQGSGIEVCQILDFLTNLAIKKVNYQIQKPIYHKPKHIETANDKMNDIQSSQNDDIDDLSDDSLIEDIMDDDSDIQRSDDNQENEDPNMKQKKNYFLTHDGNEDDLDINDEDENEHKTTMSVMETNISSKEWKLELETVSHLLEDRYITGIKEWITHLKKSKHHGKALKEIWPDSKAKLTKYSNKLNQYLKKISSRENHLNREFAELGEEYHVKYMRLQELNNEYNDDISQISSLTSNLQEVNEKIADIKIEMENRNNTMTDMTPIRRLREIHNQLKSELIDLDLRIGVTRQQLNHSRLKHQPQNA